MKKWFLLIFIVLFFSSCQPRPNEVLYVFNWGDFMDMEVVKEFEKEYNIKVKYLTFDSNESMYTLIKNNPGVYDLAFPSDYMVERMIKENLLEPIDFGSIPNYRYVDDYFKQLASDPNNEYSICYMWGTLGILYNKTMLKDPVRDWNILWNETYKKQIYMYDSVRDSFAVSLLRLGYSLNTTNLKELQEAKDELIKQMPLVKTYLSDLAKDNMIANECALSVVYSGDAIYAMDLNEDLDFFVPKGSNLFFDAMVIPKDAKNKKAAELFINFLLDPKISARNSEYIGYTTPNKEALQFMDQNISNNPHYWPTQEQLNDMNIFVDLGSFKKTYDDLWLEVLVSR